MREGSGKDGGFGGRVGRRSGVIVAVVEGGCEAEGIGGAATVDWKTVGGGEEDGAGGAEGECHWNGL